MRKTHVSVSKHLKRIKRGAWICPHAWKIDSTRSLIKVNYASSLRPFQAALKVAESVPTAKTLKKKSKLSKHFPLFGQISKRSLKVM